MINFALVKSKNVRQPWGLTRTFYFFAKLNKLKQVVRRRCLCHSAIGNGHRFVSDYPYCFRAKALPLSLVNWKRALLCERLTLLLSCEGVAFVSRLHSVANFCNKSQVTQFQNVWKTVL